MKLRWRHLPKLTGKLVALLIFMVTLAFIILTYGGDLWDFFSDQQRIENTIESAGPWGPVVFIAMQALQVLVAPIPGQVTGFAAGYLFGTLAGLLYSIIGLTLGFTLVFLIARKLGRPAVEYFADKKVLKKFDYLVDQNGLFVFFLIFLLPFFPDDIICYIAGLTRIPIKSLVVVSIIARIPSTAIIAFAGQEAAANNFGFIIWLTVGLLPLAGLIWWQRKKLERWVKHIANRKH